MRNNLKKILCLMLTVIMIVCSNSVIFADEKEYFSGTIEDITDDDEIIVTILHEYSGLDKEFSKEDFPGIEIERIEYITSLKDPNKDYPMLNLSEYCQILNIVIANKGEENVLEAIRILEENPIVKRAFPNAVIEVPNLDTRAFGDVNNDKESNAKDALLILKHAAKINEISSDSLMYADINADEIVNAEDALMVLKIAAKI